MSDPKSVLSPHRRLPWATLLLSSIAVGVFLQPKLAPFLAYDRGRISNGQVWRIMTCHWTHYSASHLFWDLLMFVVLGAVCELRSRTAMLASVALSALLIPAAMWFALPTLNTYRGLSGIDCALFMMAAGNLARTTLDNNEPGPRTQATPVRRVALFRLAAITLTGLLLAKEIVECAISRTVFVNNIGGGFVPVPLAHLVGAAAGMVAGRLPPARGKSRA
jgi:rhomboid family GlyGly-CTERM serine protease